MCALQIRPSLVAFGSHLRATRGIIVQVWWIEEAAGWHFRTLYCARMHVVGNDARIMKRIDMPPLSSYCSLFICCVAKNTIHSLFLVLYCKHRCTSMKMRTRNKMLESWFLSFGCEIPRSVRRRFFSCISLRPPHNKIHYKLDKVKEKQQYKTTVILQARGKGWMERVGWYQLKVWMWIFTRRNVQATLDRTSNKQSE